MSTPGDTSAPKATSGAALLADQAPIALVHLGADFMFQAVNQAAEGLFGLSTRNMIGRTPSAVFIECVQLLRLLDLSKRSEGDVSAPDIDLRASLYQPAIRLTVRIRNLGRDGFVMALSQPMLHEREDGVPGVAGMGRILGHEVKNPLAGISGAAQLLLKRDRPEDEELLELIRDEAGRIERLINRFSAFELYSQPSLASRNIHELLDRIVHSEMAAFEGRVTYQRNYDPSLPDVPFDSDHMHEAMLNVFRNGAEAALQAHGDTGRAMLDIRTAFELNIPTMAARSKPVAKRAIRIDIIDNGSGIDPEKAEALFEAFESSKASGRGLGLTVVKEVVAAHGGHAAIAEHPLGTCVSIYLPLKRKARS